jgi:5-formyltetrahydrofolate cyclo-ligase
MEIDAEAETVLRIRAKAVLRQRARALRNTIPEGAIKERSQRIVAALLKLPAIEAAARVALFYPIEGRNEVDLRALDAALREKGARVAYPTIDQESRVMSFRLVSETEAMEERGFGFREPAPDAEDASPLDVVVVPALQIDDRGHRIGYGAGYYDRTIPRYCPPAIAIGVAFDFQLVAEVPVTEGDVAVSMVVTDQRVLRVGEARGQGEDEGGSEVQGRRRR